MSMKQVLDKMLELETFNEVLDRLRSIIALQEKINEHTKEKKKQEDLRELRNSGHTFLKRYGLCVQ